MVELDLKRGDIVIVKFDPVIGNEQGKTRPSLVIQNNIGNRFSPLTIVAPITSKIYSRIFPTNVEINEKDLNLNGTILLNQIRTIDKKRIIRIHGNLNENIMNKVNDALKISLDIK